MTTAILLPDTSGDEEQPTVVTHPILLLPPAGRTVVRCLVEFEHGEDTGHLVERVFSLTAALFQFDAVRTQDDLHPLDVPARAGCGTGESVSSPGNGSRLDGPRQPRLPGSP